MKTLYRNVRIPAAPAKVLDETFALEESKRLELEHLAKEKLEEERRLQREHEATKVRGSKQETYLTRKTHPRLSGVPPEGLGGVVIPLPHSLKCRNSIPAVGILRSICPTLLTLIALYTLDCTPG